MRRKQIVGRFGRVVLLLSFCAGEFLIATAQQTAQADAPVQLLENDKVQVVRHTGIPCSTSAKAGRVIVAARTGSVRWAAPGQSSPCGSGDLEVVLRQQPTGNAATSPLNPWNIDPKHYLIVLDGREVRVIRVRIGPRERAPLHEHSLDRVVIYVTDQDFQVTPEQKEPERVTHRAGDVGWGTPVRHAEENVADTPFEAIVVELK